LHFFLLFTMATRSRQAPVSKHEARSANTRAKLLRAGRALFARHGYAAVSSEQIVRRAGVTRGALYHHFEGKRGLFAAVFELVEQELTQKIAERALASAATPWQGLMAGAEAMLDASLRPEVAQIILIDAPSVLGWEAWREVGERYGLGLVEAALRAAIDAGELEAQPVKPLAHVLIGALDEAILLVARSSDREQARREVGAAIARVMRALRKS
jgi:AcrR family transcriptional regulator